MKKTSLVAALAIAMSLVGCANYNSAENSVYKSNDVVRDKASEAAEAQRLYYATVNEEAIAMNRKQEAVTNDLIDVDFIGMPQEFLKNNFAPRYGYTYTEAGNPKLLNPINIRIQRVNSMEVIKNVGHLVGNEADVIMDIPNKTITLKYNN